MAADDLRGVIDQMKLMQISIGVAYWWGSSFRGAQIVDDLLYSLDRLRHSLGQQLLRAGAHLAAEEDRSVRSDLHILERHRLRHVQLEFHPVRQLVVRGDDEIARELLDAGHQQGDPVGGAPLGGPRSNRQAG